MVVSARSPMTSVKDSIALEKGSWEDHIWQRQFIEPCSGRTVIDCSLKLGLWA